MTGGRFAERNPALLIRGPIPIQNRAGQWVAEYSDGCLEGHAVLCGIARRLRRVPVEVDLHGADSFGVSSRSSTLIAPTICVASMLTRSHAARKSIIFGLQSSSFFLLRSRLRLVPTLQRPRKTHLPIAMIVR